MYWIIIVGLILWIGFSILGLIKNQFVYKEKIKMNELIFEKKDGRYKHSFETIKCLNREVDLVMDYNTMFWKFWIPVTEFKYHSNTLVDFMIENQLAAKLYAKELKRKSKPRNLKKLIVQASKLNKGGD